MGDEVLGGDCDANYFIERVVSLKIHRVGQGEVKEISVQTVLTFQEGEARKEEGTNPAPRVNNLCVVNPSERMTILCRVLGDSA